MAVENHFHCPLPWLHLSVEPNGQVFSCCNSAPDYEIGHLHRESIQDIWQGERLQALRAAFLRQEIPAQCHHCVTEEKLGMISLRQASLRKFADVSAAAINKPELRYVGLRPSNLCNLSCRICNAGLSTGWYSNAKALGAAHFTDTIKAFTDDKQQKNFFDDIEKHLAILYIAGGEPFLSKEIFALLERLISRERTDIEILINSNFSTSTSRLESLLELLSKFKQVHLDLSLDGMGAKAEYMRKGQSWPGVEKNIRFCRERYPMVQLRVAPTVSLFNILHLHDFVIYLIENFLFQPKEFKFSLLQKPDIYKLQNLPPELRLKAIADLVQLIKYTILNFGEDGGRTLITQINGFIKILRSEDKQDTQKAENQQQFHKMTANLDRLRNENFETTFPELSSLVSKIIF